MSARRWVESQAVFRESERRGSAPRFSVERRQVAESAPPSRLRSLVAPPRAGGQGRASRSETFTLALHFDGANRAIPCNVAHRQILQPKDLGRGNNVLQRYTTLGERLKICRGSLPVWVRLPPPGPSFVPFILDRKWLSERLVPRCVVETRRVSSGGYRRSGPGRLSPQTGVE